MEKTIRVNGMMCGHCEARVQDCLATLPQVDSVVAAHESGLVTLELHEPIEDDVLKAAIEDLGYEFISA